MVHAVGQKRELHEPRIRRRDVRQGSVQLVQVVLERRALAGEIEVPRGQHAQRRAHAVRVGGKRLDIERAQEVRVVGNRAARVLEQEQQQVGVHAGEIAALEPEPQGARVVVPVAEVLGRALAEHHAVHARLRGLLAQKIAEQVMVTVRVAVQPREEGVRAGEALHDLPGVVAPGQQCRQRRVVLLCHAGGQAERAQLVVPSTPHLLFEIAREQVVAVASVRAIRLRERRHADGPPLGGRVHETRLVGRGKAAERVEVAAYLVGRESQIVRSEHRRALRAAERAPFLGQLGARQQQHGERAGQAAEHGRQRFDDLAVANEVQVVDDQRVAALERAHLHHQLHRVLHGRRGERRAFKHGAHARVIRLDGVEPRRQLLVEHRGHVVVAVEADPHARALRLLQPQQRRHRLAAARRRAQVHEAPRAHGALDSIHHPQPRRAHVGKVRRCELLAENQLCVVTVHASPFLSAHAAVRNLPSHVNPRIRRPALKHIGRAKESRTRRPRPSARTPTRPL